MSSQAELETLVASENADISQIGTDLTAVSDAIANVSKEVQSIINAAPAGLDLTSLQAAQADLDSKVAALGGVAAAISGIVPSTTPTPSEPTPVEGQG